LLTDPHPMRRSRLLWVVAVVITLGFGVWQRLTGPTYPVRGRVQVAGMPVRFKLTRTHGGPGDQLVPIVAPDHGVTGELRYRRYPSDDPWTTVALARAGDTLVAVLPHQPPAGKLAYEVTLIADGRATPLTERPVITRFKGNVPAWVLAPHILAMLLTMLLSTRAGLAALTREPRTRTYAYGAILALAVGGFLLGPLAQLFAFGRWWEGVPYAWDFTDNKTLMAGIVWAWAAWRMRGGREARGAILAAAIVTLAIFAVPHSLWGSEINWRAVSGSR
jgi:hypothetical protein